MAMKERVMSLSQLVIPLENRIGGPLLMRLMVLQSEDGPMCLLKQAMLLWAVGQLF